MSSPATRRLRNCSVSHRGKGVNEEMENISKCHRCQNCNFKTHSKLLMQSHTSGCKTVQLQLLPTEYEEWCEIKNLNGATWLKCKHCAYITKANTDLEKHFISKHIVPQYIQRELERKKLEETNVLKRVECSYKTKEESQLKEHRNLEDTNRLAGESESKSHFIKIDYSNLENTIWFKCEDESQLKEHVEEKHSNIENTNQGEECPDKSEDEFHLEGHVEVQPSNFGGTFWLDGEEYPYEIENEEHLREDDEVELSTVEVELSTVEVELSTVEVEPSPVEVELSNLEDTNWLYCEEGDCDYKSKDAYDLTQHIKVKHRNPEDTIWFDCEHCAFKSKTKRNVERHIIRKHIN